MRMFHFVPGVRIMVQLPSPVHSKYETVETEGDTKRVIRYCRRKSQVQEL